jgi:hypothetical protein
LVFLAGRREAAGVELGARLSAAVGTCGLVLPLTLRGPGPPAEALVLLRREKEPDVRTQPSVASPVEEADDEPEADELGEEPRPSACWTCWWSAAAEADDVADGLPFLRRVVLFPRGAGSAGREGALAAMAAVALRELGPATAADGAVAVVVVGGRKLLPEPALDDSAFKNWLEELDEVDPDDDGETGDGRRRRPNASDDGPGDGTGRAADVALDGADPCGEGGIDVARASLKTGRQTFRGASRRCEVLEGGARWPADGLARFFSRSTAEGEAAWLWRGEGARARGE